MFQIRKQVLAGVPSLDQVFFALDPVEVTPVVTDARVTRAVCGAFGSSPPHATSVRAISAPTAAAPEVRRSARLDSRFAMIEIDGRDHATRLTPIPAGIGMGELDHASG